MKIYVAAPWVRREDAKKYASEIQRAGFEVTSRWFGHEGDPRDAKGLSVSKVELFKQVREDLEDIQDSDIVVVLNLELSEGKAVETGFAIATGTPFLTIGPRGNVFAVLGEGEFETIEQAIEFLRRYQDELSAVQD